MELRIREAKAARGHRAGYQRGKRNPEIYSVTPDCAAQNSVMHLCKKTIRDKGKTQRGQHKQAYRLGIVPEYQQNGKPVCAQGIG